MKNYRLMEGTLGNTTCGRSLLDGPVGRALLAGALAWDVLGCSSSSSSPVNDASTVDSSSGAVDSGSLPESGGSTDSSSVSRSDSSVESDSSDSPSTESGSADTSPGDSGESEAGRDGSRDANLDGPPPANDSGSGPPADFFMRYEAESSKNTLTYPVEGYVTEGDGPCPGVPGTSSDGVKEGANCASGSLGLVNGGYVVNQILGRSPCTPPTSTTSYTDCGNLGGGVTFNGVTVPVDGSYDVTFWYHSGGSDTYGDANCGGVRYDTAAGNGQLCRPHMISVNGVQMSSTINGQTAVYYEFPAYASSWSIVHGAVAALPLKAGSNTILIKAPGSTTSDAADIDALDVQPSSGPGAPLFQSSGQGGPPTLPIGLVTPVVNWN
jgi:hypothetical protein